MAIRNILHGDDPALRKHSRAVTDFNKRLHVLLDDMRETLIEANGLGLAAPQVGVLRRAFLIVDLSIESEDPDDQIIELVNPEILEVSGEQTGSEGCLSIPGVYGLVSRPDEVKVRAQDRFGRTFVLRGKELTARAICHETDHLNGIVFTSLTDRFLTEEELEAMREEREARKAESREPKGEAGEQSEQSEQGAESTDSEASGLVSEASATDSEVSGLESEASATDIQARASDNEASGERGAEPLCQ